jgi:nucleolar protein 58
MLATKASLSVRVDALSEVDAKSSLQAPSVGLEYRAKLESRLRALEYRSDLNPGFGAAASSSFMQKSRQQQKFQMNGAATKIYNNAADSVMIPTQPGIGDSSDVDLSNVAKALEAVMDVKEERSRRKEEKRAAKEAKKEKKKAKDIATAAQDEAPAPVSNAMDVDDDEVARKEKKRLKKEKKKAEEATAASGAASASAVAAANIGPSEKKEKKRHAEGEEAPKKKKKKSE